MCPSTRPRRIIVYPETRPIVHMFPRNDTQLLVSFHTGNQYHPGRVAVFVQVIGITYHVTSIIPFTMFLCNMFISTSSSITQLTSLGILTIANCAASPLALFQEFL